MDVVAYDFNFFFPLIFCVYFVAGIFDLVFLSCIVVPFIAGLLYSVREPYSGIRVYKSALSI